MLPAQSCRGAGRQGAEGGAGGAAGAAALRRPGGVSPPPAFACRAAWGVAGVLRRGLGLLAGASSRIPHLGAPGAALQPGDRTPGYRAPAFPTFCGAGRREQSPSRFRGQRNTRILPRLLRASAWCAGV